MEPKDVQKVFGDAVGDAAPDLGPLIAGAAREGAALRRRRAFGVAGATAVVAVLAVGGALTVTPGPGEPADGTRVALTAASGGTPATAAGQVPLTGQAAVLNLARLVPVALTHGDYTGRDLLPGTAQPEARGELTVRTDAGTARIGMALTPDFSPTAGKPGVPGTDGDVFDCANRGPQLVCRSSTRPDGSRLLVWESRVGEDVQRGADLLRADRVRVSASSNSVMDRQREKRLAGPPMSLEQLEAVVLSPSWTTTISAEQAARAAAEIKVYTDGRATLAPKAG
ncbi:hypothetical protein GCM10020229_83060 [Kitasatospora albolonga]|uniref:hypothetical protein n=1 Tax=Kitasatospora albolonga TaxID=68173 RepID=UPI0031F0E3A0